MSFMLFNLYEMDVDEECVGSEEAGLAAALQSEIAVLDDSEELPDQPPRARPAPL